MVVEARTAPIACRSYTHARRYPWVIGRIGGWQLPTQLTLAQLAALGTTLFVLVGTRGLWAHLPPMANLLVEISLPAVAAWATRRLRVEGRSPLKALAGLAGYLAGPRRGRVQGKARPRAVATPLACRVLVCATACGAPAQGRR